MTQHGAGLRVAIGDSVVNRLGFGAMRLTGEYVWGPPADPDAARRVLRRAVELGVDFVDTADSYGPEVSENLIREALYPYDGLLIATKGGLVRPSATARTSAGTWPHDASPQHLRGALEGSLRRLGVDAIDLYQLHFPDPDVPLEESLQALIDFKEAGKIKHIGLCNVSLEQIELARTMTEIASVQNRFSVVSAADDPIVDYCTAHGIAFIPYAPTGGGRASLDPVQSIADKYDVSTRQIALAWLLARSPVMLPIPGTSSMLHLEENMAARTLELESDDLVRLAELPQSRG